MTKTKAAFNDLELRDSTKIAVLDIGSNSFHLVVARVISGTVQILHKMKQKVRLADGLSEQMILSDSAMQRGLDALRIIEESLKGFEPNSVRIVATYTLRKAKNTQQFIRLASEIFSYPVEIVSGEEEARLIYNGVAHTNTITDKTLVIDIGGGSTEFIIGEGFEPHLTRSLDMGCVSFTNRFFGTGEMTEKRFAKAITSAQQHLEQIEKSYAKLGWKACLGTSGSIESMVSVVANTSGLDFKSQPVSLQHLESLKQMCIETKTINDLQLGEINEDRKQVFAAGLAILIGAFKSLNIKSIEFVSAALREGVIYEMEDSLHHENVRERSAQSLATRYDVDTLQAGLVLTTAMTLYNKLKKEWGISDRSLKMLLEWAALLHEIGLHIHSRSVQKHSAYILQHSDLHGFNFEQQQFLASLARFYRKKLKPAEFPEFSQFKQSEWLRCLVILRLAVALNIKRQKDFLPEFEVSTDFETLSLSFPDGWLEQYPVLKADLDFERLQLKKVGIKLVIS